MKNSIIVLKVSGKALTSLDLIDSLFAQIKKWIEQKQIVIIVHGGGVQISELLSLKKVKPQIINGLRKTDPETLNAIKLAYGQIAIDLSLVAQKKGLSMVHLTGLDSNLLTAKQLEPADVYGAVGLVEIVNQNLIQVLLNQKFILLISPLAATQQGKLLNINADEVAAQVAECMQADKLIFLTDEAGVYSKVNGQKKYFSKLTPNEIKKLIKQEIVHSGMIPKLNSCIHALRKGVKKIHIVNMESLANVLANSGDNFIGTVIVK
ncbi:MAG: acetylglutamate kinase [Candidatus Diapherotrites archaeon]|nr:acetylglutamate kinase [Candidatus Diapherotrites archaeon]